MTKTVLRKKTKKICYKKIRKTKKFLIKKRKYCKKGGGKEKKSPRKNMTKKPIVGKVSSHTSLRKQGIYSSPNRSPVTPYKTPDNNRKLPKGASPGLYEFTMNKFFGNEASYNQYLSPTVLYSSGHSGYSNRFPTNKLKNGLFSGRSLFRSHQQKIKNNEIMEERERQRRNNKHKQDLWAKQKGYESNETVIYGSNNNYEKSNL